MQPEQSRRRSTPSPLRLPLLADSLRQELTYEDQEDCDEQGFQVLVDCPVLYLTSAVSIDARLPLIDEDLETLLITILLIFVR